MVVLENISIFNFELTEDEMNQIEKINRDEKHDCYQELIMVKHIFIAPIKKVYQMKKLKKE